MAEGIDRLTYMRIDEFIDTVNDDELDTTLDKLLLDRYGSKSERLARLRRAINNESTNEDYVVDAWIGENTDEPTTEWIKANRELALNNWIAEHEPVDHVRAFLSSGAYPKNPLANVTMQKQRVKKTHQH